MSWSRGIRLLLQSRYGIKCGFLLVARTALLLLHHWLDLLVPNLHPVVAYVCHRGVEALPLQIRIVEPMKA